MPVRGNEPGTALQSSSRSAVTEIGDAGVALPDAIERRGIANERGFAPWISVQAAAVAGSSSRTETD
jgi:hypothetical protein